MNHNERNSLKLPIYWYSRQGVGKLWPSGQILSTACFYKWSFIETFLYQFIYTLSMAAFMLQWQSWVHRYRNYIICKARKLTMWPFTERSLLTPTLELHTSLTVSILNVKVVITTQCRQKYHKTYKNSRRLSKLKVQNWSVAYYTYMQITYILRKFVSKNSWKGNQSITFVIHCHISKVFT